MPRDKGTYDTDANGTVKNHAKTKDFKCNKKQNKTKKEPLTHMKRLDNELDNEIR